MTDISEFGIVPVANVPDQLPPTVAGYGWLTSVQGCELQKDPKGKDASLLLNLKIVCPDSDWHGHQGFLRMFMGGQNPDAARRRLGKFVRALGLETQFSDTDQIVGRLVIIGMEVNPNKEEYTRPTQWWEHTEANQKRITNLPAPGWGGKPNARKASQSSGSGNPDLDKIFGKEG